MAFYQAGVELLGYEPPWGALTGVRPVKLPSRAMKRGASPEQARQDACRMKHAVSDESYLCLKG